MYSISSKGMSALHDMPLFYEDIRNNLKYHVENILFSVKYLFVWNKVVVYMEFSIIML